MSGKKVDWDFRFIMAVFTLSAVFGIWLCFQAYPAQSQAALDLTVRVGLPVAAAALGLLAVVRYRRRKQEELAKEAAARRHKR